MAMAGPRRSLATQLVSAALLAVIVVAIIVAGVTGREALEERTAATSATDLRLAVLTIAPVNSLDDLDDRQTELFGEAVEQLAGDHTDALHSLQEPDRSVAASGVAETAIHGQNVLDGMKMTDGMHSLKAHADLEEKLRQAAIAANSDASGSERRAAGASAVAGVAALLSAWRMLKSRSNRQSERVQTEVLHQAADRFSALLDDSPEATAIIGPTGAIAYHAASFDELFPDRLLHHRDSLIELAVDDDRDRLADHLQLEGNNPASITFRSVLTDNGQPREFAMRVSDLRKDPLVGGWLIAVREVSAEIRATRELEGLVGTDALTGLPNRRALMSDLEQLELAPFGFLMIDLDGFKQTNDTFGHDAGDELLKAVVHRFDQCLANGDRLYRLGGDEFGVVTHSTDEAAIAALGSTLVATLHTPIRLSAGFEQAQGSVGVAVWNLAGAPTSVLHRADIALYEAKSAGGNQVQVVHRELEERFARRRELSRALDEASLDNEFSVVYQPIVDAETGRTMYLEALLRWTSPTLGFVSPDVFISLAESSGQIVEMGLWVLRRACSDLVALRAQGLPESIGVTVNVSPRQLGEADFSEAVQQIIRHCGLAPDDVTIEITESALVSGEHHSLQPLEQLRSLGCHIACDDFGSGYSNLGQLLALPLDLIKVDRELLIHLSEMRGAAGGANDQPCEVMSAIVSIGHAMSAPIVAEGVETAEQHQSLAASGVALLQGYLFSKPIAIDDVLPFVMQHSYVPELT